MKTTRKNLLNRNGKINQVQPLYSNEYADKMGVSNADMTEASASPLGDLLKSIAKLPEIRQEKVDSVRSRLSAGDYDVDNILDAALDRVLEEYLG